MDWYIALISFALKVATPTGRTMRYWLKLGFPISLPKLTKLSY